MTPNSVHTLNASLQTSPVAITFSSQLLLTHKSSTTVKAGALDESEELITVRATKITATLKNIQGYSHGGINE